VKSAPSLWVSIAFLLAFTGCSSSRDEGYDHEHDLSTSTTSDALSTISCSESKDTGYKSGSPFAITVVTVDGKKVEKATANAYYVMAQAAAADGVNIKVVSGFRTMEEQEYLYGCYVNCSCNNCNLAAKPGYSNHQSGHALDLNTSAGGVLAWLNAHGAAFGFSRTVPSEPWHWEWWGGGPGGGPCSGGGSDLVTIQMGTLNGSLSSDVDGDGTADACARSSAGIACSTSGDGFATSVEGPALSNEKGWKKPEYFGTIRMGDVTGDGKADVCARAAAGIQCWPSHGDGFGESIAGPKWSDESGWAKLEYWSTLRLADVNGDDKADVCARSSTDFRCHLATGTGFDPNTIIGPPLSNASGWNHARYYGTLRMADVNGDGKADVCARSSADFSCWLSDGAGFPQKIKGPALSNDSGWDDVKYWSTLRMPDVDGDGRADLCARAAAGIQCWPSNGTGFLESFAGPELSNAKGWDDVKYYSTIRFGDLNRDGKDDLCARAAAGLRCWLSDGAGFPEQISSDALADENGWGKPEYYSTIRLADANGDGRADVCARAAAGIRCWHFDGSQFTAAVAGPAWADENGWDAFEYYSTLQIGGGCVAKDEICNQLDDDCDGEADEGNVCESTGGAGAPSGSGGGGSGGVASGAGGTSAVPDRGGTETAEAGCACATTGGPTKHRGHWLVGLGFLAAILRRRPRSNR
jgi:MYXO-CTERM domain-containing protein